MGGKTLVAMRKNLFSWNFTVMDGSAAVAEINMSWWRDKGALTVERRDYPIHREGLVGGAFILEGDDAVMARAEKPNPFSRSFEIQHGDRHYVLKRKRLVFCRTYVLLAGDSEVGSIAAQGIPSRRLRAVFPEELPLPVSVFILWLVILQRKRAAKAAGHGGGS